MAKNPKTYMDQLIHILMDELFKVWSAEKVEKGVPLVIGQHGGHYGQGLIHHRRAP